MFSTYIISFLMLFSLTCIKSRLALQLTNQINLENVLFLIKTLSISRNDDFAKNIVLSLSFPIIVLLINLAWEFNIICNKFCIRLFWIKTVLISWILLLSSTSYSGIKALFSVSVLFWIVALEYNCVSSKASVNLFRIKFALFSWILLLSWTTYTVNEASLSVRVLFSMIALEFDFT